MKIINRFKSPTPKFYKHLRNIGLGFASIGGMILTAPVSLPASLITLGGYILLAGGITSTIAQSVVHENHEEKESK